MSGWSRPKLADNSKAFYNRLRELSDKHDERGQELLRAEDGAGMHSTRSKRACASVKNPFPATNPYHSPVPKPTLRTSTPVKSAQEPLKKAAGLCSGGAPDDGVEHRVPGPESGKECWADAETRLMEQLSLLGASAGSLDKLKVSSLRGRPLTKWEKLSLGQSATRAEVSAVEALLHNPVMAVRMLVEQNVAAAMSASPRTTRKAPAAAQVDCGQRSRGAPAGGQRRAGSNGSLEQGAASGSGQGVRSVGGGGSPARDLGREEANLPKRGEMRRRSHQEADGGRPHSAQPGLTRHCRPQQDDCSSVRAPAAVAFMDRPASPSTRLGFGPRPSSPQPLAVRERAPCAFVGAVNQTQAHLQAGRHDASSVPYGGPGAGTHPRACFGQNAVVRRNNKDTPDQGTARSNREDCDDVCDPAEERELVGDVADAAPATGGGRRRLPARPLSAQPRGRKEPLPERPWSARPAVRSSTMGHLAVNTSASASRPAPPPPPATVSADIHQGSDGSARPCSAASVASEKDFTVIEEEDEGQFFQDVDERDEDDLVYRQMDAAQAQVRPRPRPGSTPAGWIVKSHSTANVDPNANALDGSQHLKQEKQARAHAENSSEDGWDGPLVALLTDGNPAVSSHRDHGASPPDSVRSWSSPRPWSRALTEDGQNSKASRTAWEEGCEAGQGARSQHAPAVVPRMARPQSASASGSRPAAQEKHASRAEMELNLQLSRVSTNEEMDRMQNIHRQLRVLPNKQLHHQQPANVKGSRVSRPRSSYTLKERMEAISRAVMEEEDDQARRLLLRRVSAMTPKVVHPPELARVAAVTAPAAWNYAPAPNRVPTPLQAEIVEDNNAMAVRPPSSAWDGESQSEDLPPEMCQPPSRNASSASDIEAGDEYTKCHVLMGHIASELEQIGRSNGKSSKKCSSDHTVSEPVLHHRLHRIVRRLRLHVTQNSAALQGTCDALANFPMEKQDFMLRGCVIMGHAQLVDMIKMRLSQVYPISTSSSS